MFRFSLYMTLLVLSTLRMAFPLLSTYARWLLVATDWFTQIASPCVWNQCRSPIEPRRAHIRKVVIISVEIPAVEKRLSLPCVDEIVGCVHARKLRQHCSRECYRNGSKHVPHLREGWSLVKISGGVLTVVRERVEGKWESESEGEQPYVTGRGYLGYSWVHVPQNCFRC